MMRKLYSIALLAAIACEPGAPPARPEDLRGPRLTQALPRPAMALVRDDGQPLDFRADTMQRLHRSCVDIDEVERGIGNEDVGLRAVEHPAGTLSTAIPSSASPAGGSSLSGPIRKEP